MKKKFLAVLTLAILLMFGVAQGAWAATVDSGQCGDDLTWTLDSNGTLTISGSGAMDDYTRLKTPWPENEITKIIIEPGVKSIGNSAFCNQAELTKVQIPNTVYSIGNDAFASCTKMKSIIIPGSVEIIKNGVFRNCASLSEVKIGDGVKYIESWAFNGTFSAFSGCYNLTEIYIPASIIRIENNAFAGCSNLMNIIVDDNNVQYSSYNGALYNKEGSTLIICPPGKQNIELSFHTTEIDVDAFGDYFDGAKLEVIVRPHVR